MHRTTLIVFCALLFTPLLFAQNAPPEKKKDPNRIDVMVTGCLHGEMLVETRPADADVTSWKDTGQTYRLKAARALMRTIKEHSGQIVEVSGTADSRQLGTATKTGGVHVGKRTRFVFGAREETNLHPPPFSPPLEVTSFKAVGERCQ